MDFRNFSELREFVRRYNSTSILEIGSEKCWQKWGTEYSQSLDWSLSNAERNYAIRLMLLASAGNPYRSGSMSVEAFDKLIHAYHNWDGHTISDRHILNKEAEVILSSIQNWELGNQRIVNNWSLKLSDALNLEIIRAHVAGLFIQRTGAFQNAGFGKPDSRIKRTIKLIELLDSLSEKEFSKSFSKYTALSLKNYFRQFLGCLVLFVNFSKRKGFCNFSQLPDIDDQVQALGITPENLKIFIRQNSMPFSTRGNNSFRSKVNQTLDNVPDFYKPFFYNHFLETPFIELNDEEFCLPDPFSFTESCWNQVRGIVFQEENRKKLERLLGNSFESYLENVLLPFISPGSFEKISEVQNPSSGKKDKRADFLIKTSSSYIVLECKSSIMASDTSAYFQADKLAELWCRIHIASEQIGATVQALNLYDKPVIPLIITFYDSIAASSVFEEMIRRTDYCSLMDLNMPPIVRSLHEFEHWISDRSLNNWAELVLSKQNASFPVKPDHKGHNYGHLRDVSIL